MCQKCFLWHLSGSLLQVELELCRSGLLLQPLTHCKISFFWFLPSLKSNNCWNREVAIKWCGCGSKNRWGLKCADFAFLKLFWPSKLYTRHARELESKAIKRPCYQKGHAVLQQTPTSFVVFLSIEHPMLA